ncbi:MAG: hypothetical protein MJ025_06840, partial [Victivallaceae bacterium]|nr:hypothetical protein [Victivallaceae bacterium]
NRYTAIGEVYNVTCDRAVTLRRYVELCAEAVGTKANIACLPLDEMLEKYKGVCGPINLRFLSYHMCHSNQKARTQIRWTPSCTAEKIIMDTARWAATLK